MILDVARAPHEAAPDVIIVGSGPAGSTLGILLARYGWRVTMLERAAHPRPKPCGECVNPGAIRALERLGLLDPLLALGPARLEGWLLRTAEGHSVVGRFGETGGWGLGLPRADMDEALALEAVRHGVHLEEGVHVQGVALPGLPLPAVSTREADGHRALRSARLIVGADGLRSVIARAINAPNRGPRVRKVSLTCRVRGTGPDRRGGLLRMGGLGTVGLAPVHRDLPLWNGTVVVDPARWGRALAGRPRDFFVRALEGAGITWTSGPEVVDGPWSSGPFDVPRRQAVADGVLLVGDAAGYYDPLTGQGIYRAITSAELAAPVIDRALRGSAPSAGAAPAGHVPMLASLACYERKLHRAFRIGRGIQRAIEAVVSNRRLREIAFGRLERSPAFGHALVRVTGDVASPWLDRGAWRSEV